MWREWVQEWFPYSYDHVFIAYLPNKDRAGKEFDVEPWETRALRLQARLFRGATSYPSRGAYRTVGFKGMEETGIILESTRMIVSFVSEDDLTREALRGASDFLREFGRSTNQENVAFVLDGEMYYIEISPNW